MPRSLALAEPWSPPAAAGEVRRAGVGLVVRLSLLLLLLYPPGAWYARLPLAVLAVVGILVPRLAGRWPFWAAAAALVGVADLRGWYAADNHKFLLAYWCLALACAFAGREPRAILSASARWLLVFAFGLSVAWKLAAPDFVDGAFFQYTLLTDPRFEPLSRLLAGYTEEMAELNQVARRALVSWDSTLTDVRIVGAHQVRFVAVLMTAWTLLVEGAIALLFLLGRTRAARACAHALLIGFAASTYLVANVLGFGSTLAILGAAHAAPWSRRWAHAHVALFVALQVYRLPWWGVAKDAAAALGG